MSRRCLYTCDRCKREGPEEVHSFDFGKDYGSGRDLSGLIPRVIVDLCGMCWADLLGWLGVQSKPR